MGNIGSFVVMGNIGLFLVMGKLGFFFLDLNEYMLPVQNKEMILKQFDKSLGVQTFVTEWGTLPFKTSSNKGLTTNVMLLTNGP